jgi:hypothetical protein
MRARTISHHPVEAEGVASRPRVRREKEMPTKRRIRVAAASSLLALGALGLIACGGGDDETTTSVVTDTVAADEEAITEVVDQFIAAFGRKDGEAACSYISEQGQNLGGPAETTPCAEVLGSGARVAKNSFLGRIPSLTVSEVTVTGDTATVAFEQQAPDLPMIRDGDDWLIDWR